MKHFDYICIGAGSGGIASANRAAMYGQRVALIEEKQVGGTCVNVGCVPKKVMWHGAQVAEMIEKYAPDYGFNVTLKRFDWKTLVKSRQTYIERIHDSYDKVFATNDITVVKGFAEFVDPKTVEVDGVKYTSKHILIATGGCPSIPDIHGAELGIDSNGFFELQEQPKQILMIALPFTQPAVKSL